jgi:hypothetical protein
MARSRRIVRELEPGDRVLLDDIRRRQWVTVTDILVRKESVTRLEVIGPDGPYVAHLGSFKTVLCEDDI